MGKSESAYEDRFIFLADGRRLGYAEYGVPHGHPALFFHGAPGSRHIHADMADIAARRGIRLIALERPGYGLSDAQPGRTMLDWTDDVVALADKLGIGRFALIGFSGGGPYALACAYQFPQRISKMALVATLAPLDVAGVMEDMSPAVCGLFDLAYSDPGKLRTTFVALASAPAALVQAVSATASDWDKAVIQARQAEFETDYAQMLRGGVEGIASDYELYSRHWGFLLEEIKTASHLWYGTADCNTPPVMAEYLSSVLANSTSFMLPNEGHCVLYPHWEEILAQLV